MLDPQRHSSLPQDLFGIIAHVRNRWRMKLALRGAVRLLAVAFGLFVLAAYGMETVRFTPTSIVVARVALVRRRSSLPRSGSSSARSGGRSRDEQVALYLEEHEPSLQATLLSAVEVEPQRDRSASPRRLSEGRRAGDRGVRPDGRRAPRRPGAVEEVGASGSPALPPPRSSS